MEWQKDVFVPVISEAFVISCVLFSGTDSSLTSE